MARIVFEYWSERFVRYHVLHDNKDFCVQIRPTDNQSRLSLFFGTKLEVSIKSITLRPQRELDPENAYMMCFPDALSICIPEVQMDDAELFKFRGWPNEKKLTKLINSIKQGK